MKREDPEFLSGMMDGEWQSLDVRRAIADVCDDAALREKWSRYHLARHALQREPVVSGGSLAERIARAVADEPTYSNVTAIGASAPDTAADTGTADGLVDDVRADEDAGEDAPVRRVVAASPSRTNLRTFAAGFGLAASVAVVTAFGLDAVSGGDVGAPPEARVADAAVVPAAEPATRVAVAEAVTSPADAVDPFARQTPGATLPALELVSNVAPAGAYWTAPESRARRVDSEARLNMFLSQHIENSPTAERQGMLPYSRLVGYDERASVGR